MSMALSEIFLLERQAARAERQLEELARAAAAFRLQCFDADRHHSREVWQAVERLDAALRDAGINVGQAPEAKR